MYTETLYNVDTPSCGPSYSCMLWLWLRKVVSTDINLKFIHVMTVVGELGDNIEF